MEAIKNKLFISVALIAGFLNHSYGQDCYALELCNDNKLSLYDRIIRIEQHDNLIHDLSQYDYHYDRKKVRQEQDDINEATIKCDASYLSVNIGDSSQKALTPEDREVLCQINIETNSSAAIKSMLRPIKRDKVNYLTFCLFRLADEKFADDTLHLLLEKVKYPITLIYVREALIQYIANLKWCANKLTSKTILEEHLALVEEYLNKLTEKEFSDYRNTKSSHEIIKGAEINMINDLFTPTAILGITPNLDKNLTGGGMLEVRTDIFKMRWNPVSVFWPNDGIDINGFRWMSYQGMGIGVDVYTPFIRPFTKDGTITYVLVDGNSINYYDRPFFCYKYIGRSVYRINLRENIKLRGTTKVGIIGSDVGKKIQSTLHRDVTVGSVTPEGWDSQVANGGRIGLEYNFAADFLLISKNHAIFRSSRITPLKEKWNFSAQSESWVGHSLVATQIGIKYSNKSFSATNGRNFPDKGPSQWLTEIGIHCRYVYRDGTLEGYGIFKDAPDEDTTSPIDRYSLAKVQTYPFVGYLTLNFGWRIGNVMVYLNSSYYTCEYWIKKSDIPIEYRDDLHDKNGFLNGEKQRLGYYYGVLGATYKF